MIDTSTEKLIRFADISSVEWLPKRRTGAKLHPRTLRRWATKGHNGIKLETISICGARCTTEAALLRFFEQLSKGEIEPSPVKAKSPTRKQSLIGHDRATAYLERLGI